MGHRQWLPPDHPWRRNKKWFNGAQEIDSHPEVPDGDEIIRQLECVVSRVRTRQKLPKGEVDWKRRSVLYDLSYWKDQLLCHNIDVMHTEKKSVVDNILGTLLNMNGKTKYNLEARQDLHKMNLRPELHPFIVVSLLFFKHVVSVAAYCIFYLLLNVTHFNVFAGRHGP
jgi:hypothetical protein